MGYFLADMKKTKVTTKTLVLVQEGLLYSVANGKLALGSFQLKKMTSFKNKSCKFCIAIEARSPS